jgi:hypothetical protein
MCEHGCRTSHNERYNTPHIRPKQLRNREVPREGSQRSKRMSRRTERQCQVDGADKLAPHSAVRCSAPEINGPVVPREFTSLLREAGHPSPSATAGAAVSNDRRAAVLSSCAFLGFQIRRGRIVWTDKARTRFKERIQAITSRSRGVSTY